MPFTKPALSGRTYPDAFGDLVDIVEGPSRRNFIRNGDFMIAQRGTSFAGITTAQYTLDGAYFSATPSGTNTITQESFTVGQTSVPDNPKKFLRVVRSVAAGAANSVIQFPIEFPSRLSGKTVTFSFWAKVASGTKAFTIDGVYSGVTPGAYPALTSTGFTATTTWTRFKFTSTIEAMTAETSNAQIAPRIVESASFGTFTLDIADVQLEEGSEATRFERLNVEEQLRWCQRFFAKSFPYATAPAQNVGSNAGAVVVQVTGAAIGCAAYVPFPVAMRAVPTITTYNPSAANAQFRNTTDAADFSSTTGGSASESSFLITATSNAGGALGELAVVHWSATAEL